MNLVEHGIYTLHAAEGNTTTYYVRLTTGCFENIPDNARLPFEKPTCACTRCRQYKPLTLFAR